MLESWARILPEALQDLTGEERNRIYRMLRLEVALVDDCYSVIYCVIGALPHFLERWYKHT